MEIYMKYGLPAMLEINDIDTCASVCKDFGLDFIELNMNFPQYQLDGIELDHYKEISKKYHLFYTIHLEEEFDVCGYNKEVTGAYLRTILSVIELAKELGMPVINMHMADGIYITLPHNRVYLYHQYKELYLNKLMAFRNSCEKAIGENDITICIENSGGYKDFQMAGIELLLESRIFALTFDIGHNHSIGGTDEPFIRKHKDRLIHMHIHDALGKENHLVIGTGEIDIQDMLELAKECNCRCVLETKTVEGLRESLDNLKKLILPY